MATKTLKGKFKPSSTAESRFYSGLRKVAQTAGHIIETHIGPLEDLDADILNSIPAMKKALEDYSKLITPWASRQSQKLLEQVQNSNQRAYRNKSKAIGRALQKGVAEKEVREIARRLMDEQVTLIKSIPIEAGQRAQEIAFKAALHGTRAGPEDEIIVELQKQLGLSTEVAISRAQLISITETARANAAINQVRAQRAGSLYYRWHNSGDEAVRPSHKKLNGKQLQGMIFSWDNPPTLDDGMTGHPGTFPRCRCFAEPVFEIE